MPVMTGRERMVAAFGAGGCRDTPAVICYEGIYIRDHLDTLSSRPWWHQYSPHLEQQVEWRGEVMSAIGQDWFRLPVSYSAEERRYLRLEAVGDDVWLVDGRDGERRLLEKPEVGGGGATAPAEFTRLDTHPESQADIDELVPLPDDDDAAALVCSGKAELAHALLRTHGDTHYATAAVCSPFWQCCDLWGVEGMMVAAVRKPDLVAYACDRFLRREIEAVSTASLLGAQGVWIEECLADLLSPDQFESLSLPTLKCLVDAIRAKGMHSIYYYCGNPEGRWDALLEAGADALAFEDTRKGHPIDLERVAEKVDGRCVLLGNLASVDVLQNGGRATLENEIARQLRAGRRNRDRFVMSTGSPVTPQTPPERIREYCDLVHRLSRALS